MRDGAGAGDASGGDALAQLQADPARWKAFLAIDPNLSMDEKMARMEALLDPAWAPPEKARRKEKKQPASATAPAVSGRGTYLKIKEN